MSESHPLLEIEKTTSPRGRAEITHAEWLVEILESYCKTCVIAGQIGKPLIPIPEPKLNEILDLKRHLGFPDARMTGAAPDASPEASPAEVDRHFREVVSRL